MNLFNSIFFTFFILNSSFSQELHFNKDSIKDSTLFANSIKELAKATIAVYKEEDRPKYLNNLFRLQALAGEFEESVKTILEFRSLTNDKIIYTQHELFSKAKARQLSNNELFDVAFANIFKTWFSAFDDKLATQLYNGFNSQGSSSVDFLESNLEKTVASLKANQTINLNESIDLCRSYFLFEVFKNIAKPSQKLILEDENSRFIQEKVLIKTKGGVAIDAFIVRPKATLGPQPAALLFTIYAGDFSLNKAKIAAAYGYMGVVAYTRGKGQSPNQITPYENEVTDVNGVIDWIVKQSCPKR